MRWPRVLPFVLFIAAGCAGSSVDVFGNAPRPNDASIRDSEVDQSVQDAGRPVDQGSDAGCVSNRPSFEPCVDSVTCENVGDVLCDGTCPPGAVFQSECAVCNGAECSFVWECGNCGQEPDGSYPGLVLVQEVDDATTLDCPTDELPIDACELVPIPKSVRAGCMGNVCEVRETEECLANEDCRTLIVRPSSDCSDLLFLPVARVEGETPSDFAGRMAELQRDQNENSQCFADAGGVPRAVCEASQCRVAFP